MRGRKPIQLDKSEFQIELRILEEQKFENRSELWAAFEQTDWAKTRSPRPLTAQVAMMKAEELGLEIVTPKGQRGRQKGDKPLHTGGKRKKVFSLPVIQSGVPVDEQKRLEKTMVRAANGSLKARIKLKCLECTNWQVGEVAHCQIKECALWDVRPYKKVRTESELTATESD